MEYSHFGYQYLDKVPGNKIHSGVDLNFGAPYEDLGKPVYAIDNGLVVYSGTTNGWGNMIVIYHDGYWSRYAHLQDIITPDGFVGVGQQIATCGGTGGNVSWVPHLHFDVIKKKLPTWTSYTKDWSIEKVKEYYADPMPFIKDVHEREELLNAISRLQKISARAGRKKDQETQKLAIEAIDFIKLHLIEG